MSELMPLTDGLITRDFRRSGRAIGRHRLHAEVRIAAVDADTDVVMAKIDNYTIATGAGMSGVVRLAKARRNMEQLAPEIAGQLSFLADDHLLGVAELLHDYRRDLRRR